MANLRLKEADRQRLGCPEVMPVDLGSVTNREAIALRKLGFPSPRAMFRTLQSSSNDNDDVELEYEAWTGFVWLALRRANIEVDLGALEFALPVEIVADEPPPEPVAEGKAVEAPEASTN